MDEASSLNENKGFVITTVRFGHIKENLFDQKLALSAKWRELKQLYQKMEAFQLLPVKMEFKGSMETFNSYKEFAERVTEILQKRTLYTKI